MDDVTAVHNLVRPHVQKLVHDDHEEMSLLRDTLLPSNLQKHRQPTGLPSGGSKASEAAPPKPPKRSTKVQPKQGVKKPSFRR